MSAKNIRHLLLLATIAIAGTIITQAYWVINAFSIKEVQESQTIQVALQKVAEQIADYNKSTLPIESVVNKISSDYYVVNVNDVIDVNILEYYLRKEFAARNLTLPYEYGIYDCSTDKMVYGNYISNSTKPVPTEESREKNLPKWNQFIYYFGIHFPGRTWGLLSGMKWWVFSSSFVLMVLVLFAYTLFLALKQRRLAEIQKDFIDNMTHELQTPISTINIAAKVLQDASLVQKPERMTRYAGIVQQESERLQRQVESVLKVTLAESGTLVLDRKPTNIHKLITDLYERMLVRAKAIHKQPEIVLQMEATYYHSQVDQEHLTNVLLNLVDNAFKYSLISNNAPVKVWISTSGKGSFLEIKVHDKGIGIPVEHQKRIYDKFFRVPSGNIHNTKGFGLGLSYVKAIASVHGWALYIQSAENEGTTVTIGMKIYATQS